MFGWSFNGRESSSHEHFTETQNENETNQKTTGMSSALELTSRFTGCMMILIIIMTKIKGVDQQPQFSKTEAQMSPYSCRDFSTRGTSRDLSKLQMWLNYIHSVSNVVRTVFICRLDL